MPVVETQDIQMNHTQEGPLNIFFCPGCKCHHYFYAPNWSWNFDFEKPTVNPSIVSHLGEGKICHMFIKDGNIEYLSDSFHDLKGQTLPMKELD